MVGRNLWVSISLSSSYTSTKRENFVSRDANYYCCSSADIFTGVDAPRTLYWSHSRRYCEKMEYCHDIGIGQEYRVSFSITYGWLITWRSSPIAESYYVLPVVQPTLYGWKVLSVTRRLYKKGETYKINKIVHSLEFWNKACDIIKVNELVIKVLCLVDGDENPHARFHIWGIRQDKVGDSERLSLL